MSKHVSLSDEQKSVLIAINEGYNVLVTGPAGSGKSTLLNCLREKHDDGLAVTASTGIAALNVKGTTLHAFAGLGMGKASAEEIGAQVYNAKGRAYENIKNTEVLAIDEISMVSGELLTKLDGVFRFVRENDSPFGGIQVIAFGDFCQLPPVSRPGEPASFAFESPIWTQAGFVTKLLTKTFRQKDQAFADALGRLRVGDIHHPSVDLLGTRVGAKVPDDGIRPVIIHTHNAQVEELNVSELAKIQSEEFEFNASDRGRPDAIERLDRDCLAPKKLRLKKGAQVMLLSNIDVQAGLVNGSLGVVTELKKDSIKVKFGKFNTVTMERREWTVQNNGSEIAARTQYPLRLAYAITSHKSQGMTLDRIECHLGNVFEHGQSYVAVSRVKTLEGLFLRKTTRHSFRAHPKAVEFYRQAEELLKQAA